MKLLIMLAILLSGSAFAQLRCVDKLVTTGRASGTHQMLQAEWRPTGPGSLTVADSARILSSLVFGKLLCRDNEVTFESNALCTAIDTTKPDLVTCMAHSNVGHFVITSDSQQNANVIFHKAPRPVDPETGENL